MKQWLLGLCCLLPFVAQAHQLVVEPKENFYQVTYWAHGGYIPYEKHQLIGVQAFGKDGKSLNAGVDFKAKTPKILIDGKPLMVTASFDAGYWTKTMEGYKNIAPKEAKEIVFNSLKSIKFGKTLFAWDAAFSEPVGLKMEVTPLINPLSLTVGDSLPVLVTKDGKALPHAGFESSDEDDPLYKTNAHGIAYIPIKKKGVMIVAAKCYEAQTDDTTVANRTTQSALVFEVK